MSLSQVRHASLALAQRIGLDRLVGRSLWRQRRLLILCYHGIAGSDEHAWKPALYFPVKAFERRMELLQASGATVLPLGEALARLRAGTLPERAVALTFDDGMRDFHSYAFPVLQRLGLPATLYLTTYYMRHERPVFNLAASYLLWRSREGTLKPWPALGVTSDTPLADTHTRERLVEKILQRAQGQADSAARDDLLLELGERLGLDAGALARDRRLCVMNDAEVATVARGGIDVELHTHRHRSPTEREAFLGEIRENAANIRAVTGREPLHFCYPSGVYHAAQRPWLREAGVLSATTCEVGLADRRHDALLLPRFVDTPLQPESTFLSWIAGTANLLPRRLGPDAVPPARIAQS